MKVFRFVPLIFFRDNKFELRKARHVPKKIFIDQNNRCRFDPVDVVFARKGKLGFDRRYGFDRKVFSHTVVTMKPICQETNPYWLLWLAMSDWLLKAIDITMNTNSGVPTLGVDFIKKILVPFPSLEEQSVVAKKLDKISEIIDLEHDRLDKLKKQKSGLMHDLLTGKVPVTISES